MAIPNRRAIATPFYHHSTECSATTAHAITPLLLAYREARHRALFAIRLRHRAHLHGMDDGICENAVRVSYERLQEAVLYRRAWTLAGRV